MLNLTIVPLRETNLYTSLRTVNSLYYYRASKLKRKKFKSPSSLVLQKSVFHGEKVI